MQTFHELDACVDMVSLVASRDASATAAMIGAHVADSTFALLRGTELVTPYVPRELQARCTAEMSVDLGYQNANDEGTEMASQR